MGTPEGLFAKFRPEDLRFDNGHVLAEYITRAQRFADSATRIENSAEQLVQGAMRTTESGIKQFKAAVGQLHAEFEGLQGQLRCLIGSVGADITKSVADAHTSGASYIMQVGEVAKQRLEVLVNRADEINAAAGRLEKAAETAEKSRQLAHQELERLRAFELELGQFERDAHARISDARADLYRGVGLWRRICFVPFPPAPVLLGVKAPRRQPGPSPDAKASSVYAKKVASKVANARGAVPSDKRESK